MEHQIAEVDIVEVQEEPQSPDTSISGTAEAAYFLWEKRGRPTGTPEEDWFEAERQLAEGSVESDN